MADVVGQIALELGLESADFKKKLTNLCSREGESAAQTMTASFGSAFQKIGSVMTSAFDIGKIISFGKQSIEAAAGVNAANSQLAQTFGTMQEQAKAAMQSVAKESGIVETRLQGVGTSIYAFAQTSGMDSATALTMMQEALQVTADSAAYYDRSLEDTAESLKSFLKGNYANDAALGISCTETTRNAAANKLYGKSFQQLSEAQKQLTLLQMVKDANALSGAMGQAARESDGWENVTGNLKEAFNQLYAVIGQPILAIATKGVKYLTAAIQQLTVYAKAAVQSFSDLLGLSMNDSADDMAGISDNADSASKAVDDTTDSVKKLKKATAGFDQLNILSAEKETADTAETGTSTAVPDVSAVSSAEKAVDGLQGKLNGLFKNTGIEKLVSKIQKGIARINFSAIGKNFQKAMQHLQPIAQEQMKGLQKVSEGAASLAGSVIGGIAETSGNVIQTVSGGIARWLEKDEQKIISYTEETSSHIQSGLEELAGFTDEISSAVNSSLEEMRPQTEEAIADMLDGFTTFGGSVATILSEAFEVSSENLHNWAKDNSELIEEICSDVSKIFNDTLQSIGEIFSDVGSTLLNWWNKDGKKMWDSMCKVVTDLGTVFLKIFHQWIMPVWNSFVKILQSAWRDCLKPIFEKLMNVISKLWNEIVDPFWKNVLKPLVDWIVDEMSPLIQNAVNIVGSVFETVFSTIGGFVGGLLDALGGLIDFISGVFTGDWEKAWQGICDFVSGIWNGIWSVIKGIINLIIDAINLLWSAVYAVVKGIVDAVGGIAGALGDLFGQDWHFSMPSEPPLIPKLAKGGLATAPTLAVVGDNKNAKSDPEVIAPLSTLKSMLLPPAIKALSGSENTQPQDKEKDILIMLNKLYELLRNQEEQYVNNIYLDTEKIESRAVKVRKRKARRYNV